MLLGGAQRSTSWVSNYPDLQRSNQLWILESRSNITRQTHSWWDRSAALSSQYLTCSNTHLCFWISGWIQLFVPKEANLPGIQRKGEVSLKQNFCIFASLLLLFFLFPCTSDEDYPKYPCLYFIISMAFECCWQNCCWPTPNITDLVQHK